MPSARRPAAWFLLDRTRQQTFHAAQPKGECLQRVIQLLMSPGAWHASWKESEWNVLFLLEAESFAMDGGPPLGSKAELMPEIACCHASTGRTLGGTAATQRPKHPVSC